VATAATPVQDPCHTLARGTASNKGQPRSPIVVRPVFEFDWRVGNMLDEVDDDHPPRCFRNLTGAWSAGDLVRATPPRPQSAARSPASWVAPGRSGRKCEPVRALCSAELEAAVRPVRAAKRTDRAFVRDAHPADGVGNAAERPQIAWRWVSANRCAYCSRGNRCRARPSCRCSTATAHNRCRSRRCSSWPQAGSCRREAPSRTPAVERTTGG